MTKGPGPLASISSWPFFAAKIIGVFPEIVGALGLSVKGARIFTMGLVLWSSEVDQMCSDIRLSDFT